MPIYVGFLRDDALLVHVFRYQRGEWTALADSVEVPRGWTVYGYDRFVRPLQVGAVQAIPEDDYDLWGRRTDYPADTTDPYVRPRTRVGIATTAPGKPYLLFPVDSGSAEWKDVAQAVWSAFVGREQRSVAAWLERLVCAQAPIGADCDGPADRRRLEAIGRLPGGIPIDSLQRAHGTVARFAIRGTRLPGGLALYHARVERVYTPLPGSGDCPISYFDADVVRRAARLMVSDDGVALSDCDGKTLSGTAPLAVLLLGGRVFVMAEQWGHHESYPVVLRLTDKGLVNLGDPQVR